MLQNPKNKTPLKAVIFDKDGTLLDLDATWARSMATTIRDVSSDTEEERLLFTGLGIDPQKETFNHDSVVRHARWEEYSRTVGLVVEPKIFFDKCGATAAENTVAKPAVLELLTSLASHSIKMAIATNDKEQRTKQSFDRLGWSKYFSAIYGSDSGFGGKPDPGMLEAACKTLGSSIDETIMVGDTTADLRAAKALGMTYVQIGELVTSDPTDSWDFQLSEPVELTSLLRG